MTSAEMLLGPWDTLFRLPRHCVFQSLFGTEVTQPAAIWIFDRGSFSLFEKQVSHTENSLPFAETVIISQSPTPYKQLYPTSLLLYKSESANCRSKGKKQHHNSKKPACTHPQFISVLPCTAVCVPGEHRGNPPHAAALRVYISVLKLRWKWK